MSIEIKVPVLPESIADATIAKWYKKPGDVVKRDESLVDLETDKVMLEVVSPANGVLTELIKPEGSTVLANDIIGKITEQSQAAEATPSAPPSKEKISTEKTSTDKMGPSVRRFASTQAVDLAQIQGSGKGGRVLKEDVTKVAEQSNVPEAKAQESIPAQMQLEIQERMEKRVPMPRLRMKISEKLLAVQHETAMLTTFNEVNMQAVMDIRKQYKDTFEKIHQVRLGLMSFFIKASLEALKRFPSVNASIDGNDIVYHNYFDIGVAVSTPRGLVVPILRDAAQMSMAEIEKGIINYSMKARDGKLTMEEMTGGTFTITNGGVFGSMLSTPILNSPQSAILGMHNIVERPIAEKGQVVIRPMMYLALSYDHRIIDGRESVLFLKTIKDLLEEPVRLLMEV